VIGDDAHGVYVRPGIAELMRDEALPQADIATPNAFELRHLTGLPDATLAQAKAAIAALQARMHPVGPRTVLLTSLRTDTTPADSLDMVVGEGGAFHLLRSPMLPLDLNGAGDAIAALFLFHRLATGSAVAALEAAGSAIHGVLRRTAEAGSRELLTVAAQDEFVRPSKQLRAIPC
jgi:pyridoxine kinase